MKRNLRYYPPQSDKTAVLVEFNYLILIPQESILHFAHHLNLVTGRVHKTLTDRAAIDNIKFPKFVSSTYKPGQIFDI